MKKFISLIILQLAILIRRSLYMFFYVLDTNVLKKKNLITIFCYHSIDHNNWRFTVSPEDFEKQINYLEKDGFDFITLTDVKHYIEGIKNITKPSIVICFDDGYLSLVNIAPFLNKKNIQPSLFILSNTGNANRQELGNDQSFLNNDQIKMLISNGWQIGSHTATHSNLITLSKTSLDKEIIDSKKQLEKELNIPVNYLAYPRGKYNIEVIKTAKQAGFTMGLTMDDEIISTDTNLLTIPRIGVDNTHSFTEFKGAFTPSAIAFRKYVKKTKIGTYL